ncbi:MAG: TolC family protein, partial [Acidobacteriota bacterium]|nr:TolC family protein [Acidobacteriota bacterium]
ATQPAFFGSVTGAGAMDGSRIAAGGLNNPVIYDRFASGINASQLITDFGRTRNLVQSAKLRAQAENQNTEATKTDVLLETDRDYFSVLRAQAVLTVAQQTVTQRQVVADQINALAKAKLKSELDVSFAEVNLSEAKLTLSDANNEYDSALTSLSYALGYPAKQNFELVDEPLPDNLSSDLNNLIVQAIRKRPELASLRLQQESAERFATAEHDLIYPTISTVASLGYTPAHVLALQNHWGAAGLNINIPILNGRLFFARRSEAEFRAQAVGQQVKEYEIRVARDVRVAYLNVVNAFDRVGITQQLVAQARLGLDLAQARYDLGLGTIVELSQAQLNETSAEIAGARAKYDYQTQRSILAFQMGDLR